MSNKQCQLTTQVISQNEACPKLSRLWINFTQHGNYLKTNLPFICILLSENVKKVSNTLSSCFWHIETSSQMLVSSTNTASLKCLFGFSNVYFQPEEARIKLNSNPVTVNPSYTSFHQDRQEYAPQWHPTKHLSPNTSLHSIIHFKTRETKWPHEDIIIHSLQYIPLHFQ